MFDKENIEAYRDMLDSSVLQGKIIEDSKHFKAVDGSYHASMAEVEAYNSIYWQYKNPFIIDKDSELFSSPLTEGVVDRILASPTYRSLIDILEERVISQHLGEEESKRVK